MNLKRNLALKTDRSTRRLMTTTTTTTTRQPPMTPESLERTRIKNEKPILFLTTPKKKFSYLKESIRSRELLLLCHAAAFRLGRSEFCFQILIFAAIFKNDFAPNFLVLNCQYYNENKIHFSHHKLSFRINEGVHNQH